ncbi:MAG TPA: hypothetical protein VHE57_09535 [Mycobacteriales bacterium]|nr:hypothetical protein [Mycobacteriales bacterium]
MSRYTNQSLVCHRCATVMLPGAVICSACCAPLEAPASEAAPIAAAAPAPAAAAATSVFANWPFGAADAEAAAQVAAKSAAAAAAAGVRHQLEQYAAPRDTLTDAQSATNSQNATHVMPSLPAQRPAPASAGPDLESVPAHGPNPFLAAARMQQAREEAAAVEAYSA